MKRRAMNFVKLWENCSKRIKLMWVGLIVDSEISKIPLHSFFIETNTKKIKFVYARIGRDKILYPILCSIFIVPIDIRQRRGSCRYRILSDPNSCIKINAKIQEK